VLRSATIGSHRGGPDQGGRGGGPGMFHNVYLEPRAYAEYIRSARFPDQTMLAMTMHGPAEPVPPLKRGLFEGEFIGLEVAVKDPKRFEGGWAYFVFGTGGPGAEARALPRAACQRCHAAHAARDNVFVQFYPVLRPRLASEGFSR